MEVFRERVFTMLFTFTFTPTLQSEEWTMQYFSRFLYKDRDTQNVHSFGFTYHSKMHCQYKLPRKKYFAFQGTCQAQN